MGYQVLDLVRRKPVSGEQLLDHIGQYPDGELEDLAAVLEELLVVSGVAGPTERGAPAVGPQYVVDKTGVPFSGVENDRAGAVSEKDGRGAVVAVDVPQMMRSTDPPSTPACWRAFFDASTASVAAFSPSATKWRALMPVRVEIHSSVVSSTLWRSLLVTILPPRALPTPTILPTAPPFKPTCPQTDQDCAR